MDKDGNIFLLEQKQFKKDRQLFMKDSIVTNTNECLAMSK